MATEIKMIKCLLCGWHHAIESKGSKRLVRGKPVSESKGYFRFDKVNPEESALISVRECRGRSGGLPEVSKITLTEAMNQPEYSELINSLRKQAYKILEILTQEK